MRWLLVFMIAAAGCMSKSPPPEGEPAPPVAAMIAALQEAGIPARGEALRSPKEFPGCPDALVRHRIHFGEDFVNVSRFASAEDAKACYADFERTVRKAGQSAWDEMEGDIFLHDEWLFLFPPERTGHPTRDQVLNVLRRSAE